MNYKFMTHHHKKHAVMKQPNVFASHATLLIKRTSKCFWVITPLLTTHTYPLPHPHPHTNRGE